MGDMPKRWSKDFVAQKRRELIESAGAPRAVPTPPTRYHEAAAVLSSFEINATLQPTGRDVVTETEELRQLVADSVLVSDSGDRSRWALKNNVRKQVLARLRTRESLATAL